MCAKCGTKHEDWIDPETGRRWIEPAWIVEVDECPGCAAVDSAITLAGDLTIGHRIRLRSATPDDFRDDD